MMLATSTKCESKGGKIRRKRNIKRERPKTRTK
jgi:hypothetical protein